MTRREALKALKKLDASWRASADEHDAVIATASKTLALADRMAIATRKRRDDLLHDRSVAWVAYDRSRSALHGRLEGDLRDPMVDEAIRAIDVEYADLCRIRVPLEPTEARERFDRVNKMLDAIPRLRALQTDPPDNLEVVISRELNSIV